MKNQIILLPRSNYWEWVSASQDFVLKFDLNLTPDPEVAGRHAYPSQAITIVNPSSGYSFLEGITGWFEIQYPEATLDLIDVSKAAELRDIFAERIIKEDPLGAQTSSIRVWQSDWFGEEAIKLLWPSDYPAVTQTFGANPEIYAYRGLPGHEGLDIRAPFKSNVYACADGEVDFAEIIETEKSPYGNYIRLRHPNGYHTIYGHLAKILVRRGKQVKAGDRIALSGSSGSSNSASLHLSLMRDGATKQGFTHFPNDAIDPRPFLQYPNEWTVPADYEWPRAKALAGVLSNPDGSISDIEMQTLSKTRMAAIKVPAAMLKSEISQIKQYDPKIFLMSHLHQYLDRVEPNVKTWLAYMKPRVRSHYSAGIRYFEIHRAPNIFDEGCFSQWHSGYDFSKWFIDIFIALKEEFPEAKFGFPALSLGEHIEGKRIDAESFLEGTDEAIDLADWIGIQSFWSSEKDFTDTKKGAAYRNYRAKYVKKMLFISEFANVNPLTSSAIKAAEYDRFYQEIENVPGIGAAFAQVLSSEQIYSKLAWHYQDDGKNSIAHELSKLRKLSRFKDRR